MASKKPSVDTAESEQKPGWRSVLFQPKVITIIVVLSVLPLLQSLSRKSEQKLTTLPTYQVVRAAIALPDRPDYIPADLLDRIWQRAELPERFSILEPGLAEKLGRAFEQSPWVREVKRIQLAYPTTIEIELEYRRPVALVRSAEGFYPIDRDGILLPPSDFSAAQLPRYPIVENVRTLPRGPAGVHWGDLAVWGAARLVDLLVPEGDTAKYWKKYDLASVRVYGEADLETSSIDHLHQISYRLITRGGSEVIWGIAPGVTDPTEPNAETKLQRLNLYYRDFGGLQSEQGPVEIDLRRWKDIARRPLQMPGETRTR